MLYNYGRCQICLLLIAMSIFMILLTFIWYIPIINDYKNNSISCSCVVLNITNQADPASQKGVYQVGWSVNITSCPGFNTTGVIGIKFIESVDSHQVLDIGNVYPCWYNPKMNFFVIQYIYYP
jgi:hypothetical protein